MNYPRAKIGDCTFSRFGFIVRADRQTDRHTDRQTHGIRQTLLNALLKLLSLL